MKRLPIAAAGLAVLILLAAACGGALPAEEQVATEPVAEEQVKEEQLAAEPQLLYFYADW